MYSISGQTAPKKIEEEVEELDETDPNSEIMYVVEKQELHDMDDDGQHEIEIISGL